MKLDFTGKTVIVTGAGHDLGRAITHAFSARGATVWACDIDSQGLDETARTGPGDCLVATVDITDRAAVEKFVAAVNASTGAAYILVNNARAGLPGKQAGPWSKSQRPSGKSFSTSM